MSVQAPASVVMIRPNNFRPNPETAADNSFQSIPQMTASKVAASALAEFDAAVRKLGDHGVQVHVFQDEATDTPDSVFPNNWFSTHHGGHVAIYPMYAESRRRERRSDIIEMLKQDYRVAEVTDYSGLEHDGLALEGTGAMVLDHIGRLAFVARSHRADPILLERFCTGFGYEPIVFDAADADGAPVYHTNVLMCIGSQIAMVGLDMVQDQERRQVICERLEETGREVIALSEHQISEFAGNAIELKGRDGLALALSSRALSALTPVQRKTLESKFDLIALDLPTIESAGGSARCMIAGIHLSPRTAPKGA
ncbi:amidinotransferase [Lentibacter algarum]|uniref:citrulline utilization hydrolase CtlX n=1 Tax=Lentibacter algarum TaxID=576131 RepID=UPI001C089E24|nr:arginine deiminase-related protein [Lentibacter algarum]MBU2982523.1 amidinotransferase [Lentibacter algarum]